LTDTPINTKAADRPSPGAPFLVSFSGIDGAGKTTQIEALVAWLQEAGLRVEIVRFWDDVAALRSLREKMTHAFLRGEKGVGSPERPVRRRDKNVRNGVVLAIRMVLCLFDTLRVRSVVKRIRRRSKAQVVIFDRYVYDQYANLSLDRGLVIRYLKFLLRRAPRPDVACLLDSVPEVARARKPEYPLAFMYVNRACYLNIQGLAGMFLVAPGSVPETAFRIREKVATALWISEDPAPILTSTLG